MGPWHARAAGALRPAQPLAGGPGPGRGAGGVPLRSGALQSAQLAWDAGLPLWVVPGDAGRVSAAGSNQWLAQGASVLLDPAQLIESLGTGPIQAAKAAASMAPAGEAGPIPMAHREAALLAALGAGACLDQLCERLRQSPSRLSERLLRLELAGLVQGSRACGGGPAAEGSDYAAAMAAPCLNGASVLSWRREQLRLGGAASALDWLLDLEGGSAGRPYSSCGWSQTAP